MGAIVEVSKVWYKASGGYLIRFGFWRSWEIGINISQNYGTDVLRSSSAHADRKIISSEQAGP
jgi:hypothetical protein